HAGHRPQALGPRRRRRRRPLRARLVPPRHRRLGQSPRQPLDHLHPLARRLVHSHRQNRRRPPQRRRPPRMGRHLRPPHRRPVGTSPPLHPATALRRPTHVVSRPVHHHDHGLPRQTRRNHQARKRRRPQKSRPRQQNRRHA